MLDEQANEIRQSQLSKEAELALKYSTYVDPEPAIVFSPTKPDIPQSITGVDRVLVTSKINNIMYKEKRAVEQARIYRDKCTQLQTKCRRLEDEKESIRYFWRNKILEGETRAAKMLRMSLKTTVA